MRASLWLASGVAAACGGSRSGVSTATALLLFGAVLLARAWSHAGYSVRSSPNARARTGADTVRAKPFRIDSIAGRRTRAACIALALALVLALGIRGTVRAQLTLPVSTPTDGVGVLHDSLYDSAPVVVDGTPLFRIAVPVTTPPAPLALAARIDSVQSALAQLLAEAGTGPRSPTVFDPATLRVHVRRVDGVALLEAVDAKHPDPVPIVTVTTVDARYNASDVDTLAARWQGIVQAALVRALERRQPAVERRSIDRVARLAAGLILASLLVRLLLAFLSRRREALEAEVAAREAAAARAARGTAESQEAPQRRRFFALALRNLEPARRLALNAALGETLLWALALAWLAAITWSLSLFAETTPLAQAILHGAFGVVTTVIVAGLLNRLLDVAIARLAVPRRTPRATTSEERARLHLRVPTIARAISGAKTFALVFIATLSILGQLGVPIGSVITLGGLAAIALSLSAQNVVRDFLNGFLVLLEDQYVIGDYVTINAFSGIVENLTLRMVQIRAAAGDVVTLAHSSVTSVVNQSRNWSRVDYRVPVDPASDVARALALVRGEIEAVAADESWTGSIVEPIEWIGIDALSKDWAIVRASVRTAPLRQFELRREINARVLAAFARESILLGAQLPPP